jgi:hypothetical protein
MPELISATMREWRWFLRRLLCTFVFFVWLYTLADHYCPTQGFSRLAMTVLLSFTAAMMSVSVSQRFHRSIQIIWNTKYRWLYFQLFFLFAVLSYMASLHVISSALWAQAAMGNPSPLGQLWQLHITLQHSFIGTLLLSCMSLLYMGTASGVIFVFWRTSLRVPTVGEMEKPAWYEDTHGSARNGHPKCGLCHLGLCLDNTCM